MKGHRMEELNTHGACHPTDSQRELAGLWVLCGSRNSKMPKLVMFVR